MSGDEYAAREPYVVDEPVGYGYGSSGILLFLPCGGGVGAGGEYVEAAP